MRKVDRNSVISPVNLANLHSCQSRLHSEIDQIQNQKKNAKGAIYSHIDVKGSLVTLYKNLCFLCQKNISNKYEIEHFLPWSKYYPERAYDWANLHLACKECNSRKRKVFYKVIDTSIKLKVNDMLLLNPCIDDVENLISFDAVTCEAIEVSTGNIKVSKTVIFLNDFSSLIARKDKLNEIFRFLSTNEWQDTFLKFKTEYADYNNITLNFREVVDNKIGELAYRICLAYFCLNSEHNVFSKRVFTINTGIDFNLIRKYMTEYCTFNNHPLLELV